MRKIAMIMTAAASFAALPVHAQTTDEPAGPTDEATAPAPAPEPEPAPAPEAD